MSEQPESLPHFTINLSPREEDVPEEYDGDHTLIMSLESDDYDEIVMRPWEMEKLRDLLTERLEENVKQDVGQYGLGPCE